MSLGLLTAFSLGCGGGDEPKVSSNNNETPNNVTNNGTTNPNNVTTNPNNVTTNPNNVTISPNNMTTSTQNNNITGSLSFLLPAEDTVYTNGVLPIVIDPVGDVEDPELRLNDDEVLAAFGAATTFDWDTTTQTEGEYELKLRFSLGGSARWAPDTKTVIVDRTAPVMASSVPADGTDTNQPNTPISVTFDEPLDPTTVDASTVSLTFDGGQTTTYTADLSADGLTIALQFDPTTVTTPYTATVSVDGATDLAGNVATATFGYDVPAWVGESFTANLTDMHYFELGGSEYVFGVNQARPDDALRGYKKDGGTWTMVVSEPLSAVYSMDLSIAGGRAHIAVLYRGVGVGGLLFKAARLFEFNPSTDTLTPGGTKSLGGDSPNGKIAIHVQPAALGTIDAIATVSDGAVSVFETTNRNLAGGTVNTFPSGDYDFVRYEDLDVHVKSDGRPDVIFARCGGASVPCVRTYVERLVKGANSWADVGAAATTYTSMVSETCDEFTNFDVVHQGDVPVLFFARYSACNNPISRIRFALGSASAWDNILLDVISTMPGLGTDRYAGRLALDANDNVFGLMASDERIVMATPGATSIIWDDGIGLGLDTAAAADKFRHQRIFLNAADEPIVIFRHGSSVQVWRQN